MNKQKKQRMQTRYDYLSIQDRNAYEQIIDRHKISIMGLPYAFIRVGIEIGVFFIVTCLLAGVPLEIFRESYFGLLAIIGYGIFGSLILLPFSWIYNRYKLNRLKEKLLDY